MMQRKDRNGRHTSHHRRYIGQERSLSFTMPQLLNSGFIRYVFYPFTISCSQDNQPIPLHSGSFSYSLLSHCVADSLLSLSHAVFLHCAGENGAWTHCPRMDSNHLHLCHCHWKTKRGEERPGNVSWLIKPRHMGLPALTSKCTW